VQIRDIPGGADFVFQHNPKLGNEVNFLNEPFTLSRKTKIFSTSPGGADFVFQHNPKLGNEVKFLNEPFTLPSE
jgi:hypothetical protein